MANLQQSILALILSWNFTLTKFVAKTGTFYCLNQPSERFIPAGIGGSVGVGVGFKDVVADTNS